MKFKIRVRNVGETRDWWEEYDKPGTDANVLASAVMHVWNGGLRPHEKPRELLEVVAIDTRETGADHDWQKTNVMTILDRQGGACYDTYVCSVCSITGRRMGLAETVGRDKKYKARVYEHCGNTVEHLAKLECRSRTELHQHNN